MKQINSLSGSLEPSSDNEIKKKHQHYLEQSTSDNTRRAYRSAIRQFEAWSGLLPADESSVIKYLIEKADTINPRTLSLHLTALSNWHRYQNLPDPTNSPTVRKTLEGIMRDKGAPRKKARALTLVEIESLAKQMYKNNDLKSIRDNAIIQIGYFGAFRRSEMVQLKIEDIKFQSEGLLILIPKSKTDQTGEGILKALPRGKNNNICPVNALKQWLDLISIENDVIFRKINRWGKLGSQPLTPTSINLILKSRSQECGLDNINEISSHSLRRGLATSAAKMGATFESIKRQGGWKNDSTVREYIEEGCLFEENASLVLLNESEKI
jgi:integrase